MLVLDRDLSERLASVGFVYADEDDDVEAFYDAISLSRDERGRPRALGFLDDIASFIGEYGDDVFELALAGAGAGFAVYQGLQSNERADDKLALERQHLQAQLAALQAAAAQPKPPSTPSGSSAAAPAPAAPAASAPPPTPTDYTPYLIGGGAGLLALILALLLGGRG